MGDVTRTRTLSDGEQVVEVVTVVPDDQISKAELEEVFFSELNAKVAADKAAAEATSLAGEAPSGTSVAGSPAASAKPKKKRKGRAAGESNYYRIGVEVTANGWHFRIIQWDDESYTGPEMKFVSVSTVAKLASKSEPLIGWAWNVTTAGVAYLVNEAGMDLRGQNQDAIKGILKDYGSTPFIKRKSAADRGTGTHNLMEGIGKGELSLDDAEDFIAAQVPPVERGYARAGVRWFREQNPTPFLVEEPLVSFQHRVAGTGDLGSVRRVEDGSLQGERLRVFTDYKTSSGIYDEHQYQVDGYLMLAAEMSAMGIPNRDFDLGSVLRLTEDGDYEEKFFEPDPRMFAALTQAWWAQEAFKQKAKEGK